MLRTVHLLRHGEVHNPDGILYGRLPGYPLSERGRAMAEAVAEHLVRTGNVTNLVSSPLTRAQETAEPIAAATGLDITTDDRIIEADNVFEGHAIVHNKIALAAPRNWKHYRNPFRPSWGEPYSELASRMTSAIKGVLPSIPDGGAAVLVSHQLPIWITRLFMTKRPFFHDPRRRECNLASLTTFFFDDGTFAGMDYVEPAAHLYKGSSDWAPGSAA